MIACSECGREFDRKDADRPVAVICGEVMGDEYIESYFFCRDCGLYTQEVYHDRFGGEDTVNVYGPLPKTRGDAIVELIRKCPDPMNKKCGCEVHREYFRT